MNKTEVEVLTPRCKGILIDALTQKLMNIDEHQRKGYISESRAKELRKQLHWLLGKLAEVDHVALVYKEE